MARSNIKPISYDTIIRGTNAEIPVIFSRESSSGQKTPLDLRGKILMLTVKSTEFDGVRTTSSKSSEQANWKKGLVDETSISSDHNENSTVFTVTIDCDDATEGSQPTNVHTSHQVNYQGMYGLDPRAGKAIFRLSKRVTMVAPGEYYFDIRVMEKNKTRIGENSEGKSWLAVFGKLTIAGTPTNRNQFDWRS